jgi:hypothetical protein
MDPPYIDLVGRTLATGQRVTSRYGHTSENLVVTTRVDVGTYPRRPGLNPSIGILEGLFLASGSYNQEAVKAVAPRADLSLFTEAGAYGPRVTGQLEPLIRGIELDPSSRQHVLVIARPGDQYTPDMPCTLSLHFLIRQGKVDCIASMRSSDILKGLPTDIIQFGLLTQVLSLCFDYKPRYLFITAATSHVYNEDVGTRSPVNNDQGTFEVKPLYHGTPLSRWKQYSYWAWDAIKSAPWEGKLPRGMEK